MRTLRQFEEPPKTIPGATSWYLADLGEAQGKQELFTKQSPQKLKVLREHALIESAVSSNRIEGVEVDQARVGTVIFGKSRLRDRDEEEVRGYRKALDLIHAKGANLPIAEETIRRLHALSRGGIGDAGEYKKSENDIIEVFPNGRREVRFRTVRAAEVPAFMAELIDHWQRVLKQRTVQPLIALGSLQPGLPLHPPVPRRQRSGLPVAFSAAVLSPRIRGRPIHQPRTTHRAEQGTLLRNAQNEFAALARGETRSLAIHQLLALYVDGRFQGVRASSGRDRFASRRETGPCPERDRPNHGKIQRGRLTARMPGRQCGHDSLCAQGSSRRGEGRMSRTRQKFLVAQDFQLN